MRNKKIIIAAVAIIAIVAVIAGIIGSSGPKPTFMYFVSKTDVDYDNAMSTVESLKESYGKKINFDIVDVDENPESKKNFPVEGQTPVLIMLNTSNDISALEFKCSDEAKLENAIKSALK